MLLRFVGENIRSFRDRFELSLEATTVAERRYVRRVPWRVDGTKTDVLTVAGIFGANASGKSNVLAAMDDMRRIVVTSFQHGTEDSGIIRLPFLLDSESPTRPSRFAVEAVIDGVRHEYGFECDDRSFPREWAYHFPHGRRALLFDRSGDETRLGGEDAATGRATIKLLRRNALISSTGAATGYRPATRIFRFLADNLMTSEGNDGPARDRIMISALKDSKVQRHILSLMKAADVGIVDVRVKEIPPDAHSRLLDTLRTLRSELPIGEGDFVIIDPVELVHRTQNTTMVLPWEAESRGTITWLKLLGPVIIALREGNVLLLDELDSSLHPHLVREIIRLFQDPETNPRRAQMIFNAFDHSVLAIRDGRRLLGRDQIWFTEKDEDGSSRLYPLTDWSPRKDEAIDDRYLKGRYGAVPILSEAAFDEAVDLVSS